MSQVLQEVLSANREYAANFDDKGNLPLPPSRRFAILTCIDARLDPAKYAGLAEGDAHSSDRVIVMDDRKNAECFAVVSTMN